MRDEPQELIEATNLYSKGEYQKAYALLEGCEARYPDWAGTILAVLMDLEGVMGNLDRAEELLQHALDEGYFYNENVLRKDSDLKDLQGRPRFEAMVEQSFERLREAQADAKPQLKIIEPQKFVSTPVPLFFGLHGNNSNAAGYSYYWDHLTYNHWLVALPQSSQVCAKDLYVWNDIQIFEKEIVEHYHKLQNRYSIDPKQTIINGFSKGGFAAIHSALKGLFPMRGFVAIAPYVPDLEHFLPLLKQPGVEKLRGYFLLGGDDQDCTPGATRLKEKMGEFGIECGLEVFPGVAHDFPANFDLVLDQALKFVLKE